MQKLTSFYIYPEDGKRLTENDKDAGVLVIATESKDLSIFGNVKEIKKNESRFHKKFTKPVRWWKAGGQKGAHLAYREGKRIFRRGPGTKR